MADDPATKPKEQDMLTEQKGGKWSDNSATKPAGPFKSKELEGALRHTRRLTVCTKHSDISIEHKGKDEPVGAAAWVQVHEEQADTQNTDEEGKEEKEKDNIGMESLLHRAGELEGATARVHIHEGQTETRSTDEEKKEEEEEEEEKEDCIAMKTPLRETDEPVRATAWVQVHEEQVDTQTTDEEGKEEKEEDKIGMESILHRAVQGEENVKPIEMECRKSVGKEGGKLKLDSFGIELEIPRDAIDCEAPQKICLRVLTDICNVGNSKEEMSVCFGVQCEAPDDLVLKLPVTYTIPHCAVITGTQDSGVKVVLYTGEGEYPTKAVVQKPIILSTSGIPSCTIGKDVLKLEMDHFSWLYTTFTWVKGLFLGRKKMCCRPFIEQELPLQETSAILHAHLYDDIKGNREFIERREGEQQFRPAVIEQHVLIDAAEGDLNMTCHLKKTQIGESVVVSLETLMGGVRICKQIILDLPNQPDSVFVTLKVGQNEKLEVESVIRFVSSSPPGIERASLQEEVKPDVNGYYTQTKMKKANPSLEQLKPDKNYKMDVLRKGHMFMLNILEDRDGSEVDVTNIKHVFNEIGYEIDAHSNLTAKELQDKLGEFVDSSRHEGMCSAVFLFMAHGNITDIECTDGTVSIEFIMEKVYGMKSMNGRPKMFFFQCCRGKADENKVNTDQAKRDIKIPIKSDVLVAYATTPGDFAYRQVRGSWFIQMLCEKLLENAHVSDLATIVEQVSGKVRDIATIEEREQHPVLVKQTISKKIYFLPKYQRIADNE